MNTTDTSIFLVVKRDTKTTEPFLMGKIQDAILEAFNDIKKSLTPLDLIKITDAVIYECNNKKVDNKISVENIQDIVERALMNAGMHEAAKAYVLFRNNRQKMREGRKQPDINAIADYIHPAKYARYIPELKRRETYVETIDRVENMHLKKFKGSSFVDDLKWAFSLVKEKKVLPSMRSLQFGGLAMEVNNNRGYNCSFSYVDRPRVFAEALFLLLSGCGVGFSVQFDHIDKLPALKFVNKKNIVHHTIQDSIEGWSDALDKLMHSYLKGYYVEFNYSKIRDAGTPLKTSGGKAPGHIGLKSALEQIRTVLEDAQGRKLRSIECHDIMCLAAKAVLSGGIRRSALISLFSLEDSEMMHAKTGNWYKKYPWREYANNSVMLKRDEIKKKQFKRIFNSIKEFGEPGFIFTDNLDHGTNPCQPEEATVLTPDGIKTFKDISIGNIIWSGKQWTKVINKWATGIKPVYEFHTRAGIFLGTENHRIVSDGNKIEVKDAESIDVCVGGAEGIDTLNPQDILDGLMIGDGTVHKASNNLKLLVIGDNDNDYHTSEINNLLLKHRPGVKNGCWEVNTSITYQELPLTWERKIPLRFLYGNEKTVRGFLRGLYTANGSVVSNRITLKAASFLIIKDVQQMLSSLGIKSYYTVNKEHDVQHVNGVYTSKQSYDLNISTDRNKFAKLINFIQRYKQTKLANTLDIKSKKVKTTYDIVDKVYIGDKEVFDITVDAEEHTYWTGGLLVSNCAEISLNSKLVIDTDMLELAAKRKEQGKKQPDVKLGQEFSGWSMCNLCEINAATLTSKEDFENAAKAAVIIGTAQASYTTFPYLGWVSEMLVEREALLGIGMTGIMDSPTIALNSELQRSTALKAVEWNKEYASKIGIRQAARVLTVKPSGTTSLALGCVGSGIHPHHAKRYFRRVVANELEPVFQYFKSKNPHMCVKKPDGNYVIEFPVEAPVKAIVSGDLTAIEFLNSVKSTQENWVVPGTARPESSPGANHNVSNTCIVDSNEWDSVADYVWENKSSFTGISFIPKTGDKIYSFAPREAVTTSADEAKWNYLIENYIPVDYLNMVEEEDTTDLSGEAACAGGACEA